MHYSTISIISPRNIIKIYIEKFNPRKKSYKIKRLNSFTFCSLHFLDWIVSFRVLGCPNCHFANLQTVFLHKYNINKKKSEYDINVLEFYALHGIFH